MQIRFLTSGCLLLLLVFTGCDRGPGPVGEQGQRGRRALPDSRVPSDHKGRRAHPVQWALRETQDCKGQLVLKA